MPAPYSIRYKEVAALEAGYFDEKFLIEINSKDPVVEFSEFRFGEVGSELRVLCRPRKLGGDYIANTISNIERRGHRVRRRE